MGAGRPTDLTPALIEKARGYLATCIDDFSDPDVKRVELPSVAGLAVYLGHARQVIYVWSEKNEEFNDILQDILAAQEKRLLNEGLGSNYNANIAKLALGKHNYHDRSEVDHTNDGGKFEPGVPSPTMIAATKAFEEAAKKSLLNEE